MAMAVVVVVRMAIVLGIRRPHRAIQLSAPAHLGQVMSVAVPLHWRRVVGRAIGVGRVLRLGALMAVGVGVAM